MLLVSRANEEITSIVKCVFESKGQLVKGAGDGE